MLCCTLIHHRSPRLCVGSCQCGTKYVSCRAAGGQIATRRTKINAVAVVVYIYKYISPTNQYVVVTVTVPEIVILAANYYVVVYV